MRNVHILLRWVCLLLIFSLLTACLARLQGTGAPAEGTQEGIVQVLSPMTNATLALDTPTAEPGGLALTAYPTFPPTPEPTFYTPNPLNAEGTPKTATPMPATLMPGQTPATMPPPPTIRVGKIVDLSHGTPEAQIIISVRRADGTYDEYNIPTRLFDDVTGEAQNQRFNELMDIKPGDEILGWQSEGNNGPASSPSGTETVAP
ncbi:MAG: hypothetical protein NT075_37760 [Chloroflexi bacterium]|nr:hypothetical protein [Chloroflexota bacterium]